MKSDAVKFSLGQKVTASVNPEKRGMITGILFRVNGHVYLVTWGENLAEQYHYEMELEASEYVPT